MQLAYAISGYKQPGQFRWLLAAMQVSTNMFDNGVSRLQTKWAATNAGGVALALGLLVGVLGGVWWKRRRI